VPKTRFLLCVLIVTAALFSTALALPPAVDRSQSPAAPSTVDYQTYIDANRILMFITNTGQLGRDLGGVFGNDYGTYFPFSRIDFIIDGSNISSPLYAFGLWMGGKVNDSVRMALAEYASEYVPGPMAGGTFQADRPEFRVYTLFKDSLESNPSADYLAWPVDQGAPLDGYGKPLCLGDQTLWAVYNDADPDQHHGTVDAGETAPLGVEVQQLAWAYDRQGVLGDVIFLMYKFVNKGSNDISDFYLSIWADPDLGWGGDDLVGCDTLHDMLFCYNGFQQDQRYAPMPPPACGFRVLAGPVVSAPGDTAYFFGHTYPDHANMHMSSFNKYINGTDPDNSQEAYWFMQGLVAKQDGAPYVYNGDTIRFVASGDPVTGTGDLDVDPDDRRMMASFGPLDFPAGDSQQVVVAFAVGAGTDRLSSITKLKNILVNLSPLYEDSPTGVDDNTPEVLPSGFTVSQNYPNPFNPSTTIEYSLPIRCKVTVEVFNIIGQRTATVCSSQQQAGPHTVHWNGTDENGRQAASGVYFYRVTAGENVTARKMILLR
jgi:hypothetical protein